MIEFNCQCGKQIKVADQYAGKRAKCRGCGQIVVIPGGSPVQTSAAAAKVAVIPPPMPLRVAAPKFVAAPPPFVGLTSQLATVNQTRPASQRGLWITLASIGIVLVVAMGFAAWRAYQLSHLPPRENLTIDQKHQQTREAFTGAGPASAANAATAAELQAISAALDRFDQGLAQKNVPAITSDFDTDRLCDELDRLGAFKAVPSNQIGAVRSTIAAQFPGQIAASWGAMIWNTHKMSKVSLSSDRREAVVYDQEIQGVAPHKIEQKRRWWLRASGSTWKVWDSEDLAEGIRVSTIMASAMASAASGGTAESNILMTVGQKFQLAGAAMQKGDLAGAQTTLQSLDTISMTADLVAIRQFMWAALHMRQNRYQDALKDCDSVEATGQDVPIIFQFRTIAYNKLGQYDNALQCSQKWEDALGADADLYYERGLALVNLKRPADAVVAFEKSLDEDHDAAGSLGELAQLLPAGNKSEIGLRLAQADSPATVFVKTAPTLQRQRDVEGMQILIDAYRARPESAGDPWLPYYDAEFKVIGKQYKDAETLLKPLVPLATVKGQASFLTEYIYASELAGDAIDAYGVVPDKKNAFRLLAPRLLGQKDNTTLSLLIDTHLKAFPTDPWVYYYQGKLHQAALEYDAADASYAKALSLAAATDSDTFRSARVISRFSAGNGLTAYHDVQPQDKVFSQLCGLYAGKKDAEGLAKLVAARRADAPNDPGVPLWDGDAKFLAGDYSGAVSVLESNRAAIQAVATDRYRFQDIYIRSEVRLKQFDAARAEANRSPDDGKDWWNLAIVECAAGNVAEATKALDELLDEDYEADEFYADPDIGPALATPAFAAWKQQHPAAARPATRPATEPATVNSSL